MVKSSGRRQWQEAEAEAGGSSSGRRQQQEAAAGGRGIEVTEEIQLIR